MTFPVQIYDKNFVQADFDGLAWQTNLPLVFEKMLEQACGPLGNRTQFSTSTSSVAIGTGSKSFTTQTNLKLQVNSQVFIVNTANTAQWMQGPVTAYTPSTGALTVNVGTTSGAGTIATWAIIMIPGSYQATTGNRIPPSADFGAVGAFVGESTRRAVERYAVGIPWPHHGFYLHTDFVEFADFTRDDTSGDWRLYTNEPVSRLAYSMNSVEFNSTTGPNHGDGVQGIWSVQASTAGRKSALTLGERGFISAYEPGNFYLTAALKFSQAFSASDLYTCRFGLRADRAAKIGDCFSSGGLGFEITEEAGGKSWFAVFNNGSRKKRVSLGVLSPLTSWAVCHIYGNMMNKEVHFRVALSAASTNEMAVLPSQYQFTEDLRDWPSDNSMLMNPCFSIEKISGTAVRAAFIDRMLLTKTLPR